MQTRRFNIFISILLFGTFCCGLASDLSVKAYVDKTVISQHQQFTLTVELSGQGANKAGNPQLPEMDAFASFLGSGSSQNIQFINGKMSVSKVLNFHFQATVAGKHQIGPVIVQYNEKQYRTDPIDIEIKQVQGGRPSTPKQKQNKIAPEGSTEDLFVEAVADKKRVYQNEPVTITYKIYTRLQVSSFGFTKEPETTGFWKEDYELPNQPVTSKEVVNGKQYTVATIKKQALFPMTPGEKTIDPLVITCEVRVQRRSRDPFGDFFNDPFFGRTEQVRVPSNSLTIKVMPLPETGKPDNFSGAVGQYKINAWVDKSEVKTNEAITYKVKITGEGGIHILPDPEVNFSGDFETYTPKVSELIQRKTVPISGSKTYEYVLVPRFAGLQKIDPVTYSYFNTRTNAYQILKTDPIQIEVIKGDETFSIVSSGASKEEVKWRGQDIRFIKTETGNFKKVDDAFYNAPLFWLIMFTPILELIGVLRYRRYLNRIHGDVAYAREKRASRAARKRLVKARSLLHPESQKAFYAEVGKALMGFLGDKLNIAEAGMISDDVKTVLAKRGVGASVINKIFSVLETCDFQRFAPSDASESDMRDFLKQAEISMSQLDRDLRR
ncbi:protein BatD [bacterium]|nr:protein BatD [bacterium]